MRGLSRRAGGQDDHVYRCTCGAWAYTGIACAVCATTRGEHIMPRYAEPPVNPPEREIEDIDPADGGYDTVKEAEGWA